MGLQDFIGQVAAGKGVEAITREANRVSGNIGKKADGIGEALSLGKKYTGEVNSIAKKVSGVSDIASAVLGGGAALAAATGVGAPIAAGLGAAAGVAKGIGEGADAVAGMTNKVNRGINRAEGAVRMGTKQLQGGIAQGANTLNTGLMGVEMKTGAMRKGIERVRKDVRTAKAQIGGTRGL